MIDSPSSWLRSRQHWRLATDVSDGIAGSVNDDGCASVSARTGNERRGPISRLVATASSHLRNYRTIPDSIEPAFNEYDAGLLRPNLPTVLASTLVDVEALWKADRPAEWAFDERRRRERLPLTECCS